MLSGHSSATVRKELRVPQLLSKRRAVPFAKEMAAARRLYYQHAELASKAENRARQSASSADCYDAMKAHAAAAAAAAFVGYITKADSHARSEREFLKKMEQFLAKERNGVAEYTRAWRHTVAAT